MRVAGQTIEPYPPASAYSLPHSLWTGLACMLSNAGVSDCAGTFTAADVHRIQTAFSDSLLIVEKDGIMQVCSPISACYNVWFK